MQTTQAHSNNKTPHLVIEFYCAVRISNRNCRFYHDSGCGAVAHCSHGQNGALLDNDDDDDDDDDADDDDDDDDAGDDDGTAQGCLQTTSRFRSWSTRNCKSKHCNAHMYRCPTLTRGGVVL